MEDLFKDFGKVFIRTPLYSYLSLFDDNNETINLEDLVHLRLADPVFLEALYWSSPQLFEAVTKFKEGRLKGPKEDRLMHTLKKYLIRASTRCTPYGIYAGTGLSQLGLQPDNMDCQMERKVRVDMGLMQNIKSRLESDGEIYPHLLYSVNNSLYSIPGQYRFMETLHENGKSNYQLSSLDHTIVLEKIVIRAKSGLISFGDIHALLGMDHSAREVNDFMSELIKTQFLLSELQPGATEGTLLGKYVTVLERLSAKGISAANQYLHLLSKIQNVLLQFNNLPIGVMPVDEIEYLKDLLDECGIEKFQDHIFHADLKKPIPADFIFSEDKVNEIKKGIFILGKLSSNSSPEENKMDRFRGLFREKYDTREIPLSEALDPEFGIGFPPKESIGNAGFNFLIEKVASSSENSGKDKTYNWPNWLQDKAGALNDPIEKEEIQIEEQDLEGLNDHLYLLPGTFSVLGSLLPSGKILLEGIGSTHANSLLGRFAYLDEKMEAVCNELANVEKKNNPEVIFAEIIFVPEGREGNVTSRPVFTEYEIPFLASSGVGAGKQIPVNDLLVSIQQDEIILRSGTLNQRVIPRLSNAHNYRNSPVPVYQFLSSVQHKDFGELAINWGNCFSNKRFLPRIAFNNIIFYRARWFLREKDISVITESVEPLTALLDFLKKWNVPRLVCFAEGDNELFIDCSNLSYLELLLEEIKRSNYVKLVEWVYDCSKFSCLKTDKMPVLQFILPLEKSNKTLYRTNRKSAATHQVPQIFEPGSEWVYFKIYCGATFSDNILLNVISPAIHSLLKESVIKKAFFIRYADPHYHIRFRLQVVDTIDSEHLATVMKTVYDLVHPFSASRTIWKEQLDTYERETERYGEESILDSEFVFFQDSLLYLNCLQDEEFMRDSSTRFLGAIKNIDKWLTLFKMSVEEKAEFCLGICNSFASEYDSTVKLQFDVKYREFKNLLPSFLKSDRFENEFKERDRSLKGILMPKENFGSYIHMSMNRWFFTQQRLMEYMCYLFIHKYYKQLSHYNQK